MPSLDALAILPRRPSSRFEQVKYALVALIAANVVYQVLVSVFAMDFLIETTQKQLPNPAAGEDIRFLLVGFLAVSLVIDVVGVAGTLFESFYLVLFYAVIVTLGGLFAVASVFNGQPIVLVDVLIYSAVGSLSFYFATLIRGETRVGQMESLP